MVRASRGHPGVAGQEIHGHPGTWMVTDPGGSQERGWSGDHGKILGETRHDRVTCKVLTNPM